MLSWELKCPHCGGPNKVAADRGCVTCQFCGAGLWVKLPQGHTTLVASPRIQRHEAIFSWDRYLKENDRPLSRAHREARRVYLPFWKVSTTIAVPKITRRSRTLAKPEYVGTQSTAPMRAFDTDDDFIEHSEWEIKPWDMTMPAFEENRWGLASLGVRAETVPLTGWDRIERDADDVCWPICTTEADAFARIHRTIGAMVQQSSDKITGDCQLITPKLSLVYWPVWVVFDKVGNSPCTVEIDAVSGRVIRESNAVADHDFDSSSPDLGQPPQLLPHRCLSCGQDLNVDDRYVVYSCENCQALIAHDSNGNRGAVTVKFAAAERPESQTWYPFWSFGGGHLLIPAFAIRNYRLLVRFGEIMSGQPRGFAAPADILWRKGMVGVTMPSDTAAGFSEVLRRRDQWQGILSQSVPDQDIDYSQPPELVYAHLTMTGTELIDPVTGLCMSRSAVDLA